MTEGTQIVVHQEVPLRDDPAYMHSLSTLDAAELPAAAEALAAAPEGDGGSDSDSDSDGGDGNGHPEGAGVEIPVTQSQSQPRSQSQLSAAVTAQEQQQARASPARGLVRGRRGGRRRMSLQQRSRMETQDAASNRAVMQHERSELDVREEGKRARARTLIRHALAVSGRADNVDLAEAEARELELLEGADRVHYGGLRPGRRNLPEAFAAGDAESLQSYLIEAGFPAGDATRAEAEWLANGCPPDTDDALVAAAGDGDAGRDAESLAAGGAGYNLNSNAVAAGWGASSSSTGGSGGNIAALAYSAGGPTGNASSRGGSNQGADFGEDNDADSSAAAAAAAAPASAAAVSAAQSAAVASAAAQGVQAAAQQSARKVRRERIVADLRIQRLIADPAGRPEIARANIETIDLVIAMPVAASYVAAAAASKGATARLSASKKDEHYARFFPADKALVSPLPIEFFGHMEPEAEAVLARMAMLMAGARKDTNPSALRKQGTLSSLATLRRYRDALGELRLAVSRELWWGNIKLVTQSLAKYRDKDATFRIATGIPSEGGGYERYAFPNGYSTQHLINPQPEAAPMAAAVLLAAGVAGLSVDGT